MLCMLLKRAVCALHAVLTAKSGAADSKTTVLALRVIAVVMKRSLAPGQISRVVLARRLAADWVLLAHEPASPRSRMHRAPTVRGTSIVAFLRQPSANRCTCMSTRRPGTPGFRQERKDISTRMHPFLPRV